MNVTQENPEAAENVFNQMSDSVSVGLVKNLVSSDVEMWPQLLNDTFYMLRAFVFDQRQLTMFNKITARMLQVIVSLLSPQAFASQELKG